MSRHEFKIKELEKLLSDNKNKGVKEINTIEEEIEKDMYLKNLEIVRKEMAEKGDYSGYFDNPTKINELQIIYLNQKFGEDN